MSEKNSIPGISISDFVKLPIDLTWDLLQLEKVLGLCPYPDKVSKRLLFLAYELKTQVRPEWSILHKAELLRDFAIVEKHFDIINDPSHMHQTSLTSALQKREACIQVSSLVWILMGTAIGLELKPLEFECGRVLKFIADGGDALYIDLANGARYLENHQILDLLEDTHFGTGDFKSFDRALSLPALIAKICLLQTQFFDQENNPELLLECYKFLVKIEPTQSHYLSEKALLHMQLGQLRSAYSDLKRYFLLTDFRKASEELKSMYEGLSQEFEPQGPGGVDGENSFF